MGFIAAIAAVVSYSDGLQVARLAGATGRVAYLYPLLPDGLIVICLIALYEGARMTPAKRPGWASAGLVLGAGLTLAQNVGAGAATGVLLAVIDGFVPVVFFVAAEVLIWTIRHGRPPVPATVPVGVPVKPPLPSVREVRDDHSCGPATEKKIRRALRARDAQWARAVERGRGGSPARVLAAGAPAGSPPPVPAGVLNGHARGG